MGPREEDNNMLLIVMVTLICVTIAGVIEASRPGPAMAAGDAGVASDAAVRVVLPFNPNTTPSER